MDITVLSGKKQSCEKQITWLQALLSAGSLTTILLLLPVMVVHASPVQYPDGSIFDPGYYLAQNPDVAADASEDGTEDDEYDAWNHYVLCGAAEGRPPFDPSLTIEFDSKTNSPSILIPSESGSGETKEIAIEARPFPTAPAPEAYSRETIVAILNSMEDVKDIRIYHTDYQPSAKLQEKLLQVTSSFEKGNDEVGWLIADLDSNSVIAYNPLYKTYSASAIKGPYIFSLLAAGEQPTNDMFLAGRYSDNSAYHRIRVRYGPSVMMNWIAGAGADPALGRYYYTNVSASDLARMWCLAYEYLETPGAQLSWCQETFTHSRNSAISDTIGNQIQTYSKAGWISPASGRKYNPAYNVYTNAGLVMDKHPYLISMVSYNSPGEGRARAMKLMPVLQEMHQEFQEAFYK